MNSTRLLTIGSILFLAIVGYFLIAEILHDQRVRATSQFKYSIVEIVEDYHQGDVRGKKILYYLNDVQYKDHCRGHLCLKTKDGDRFIIKIYLDDPSIFTILYNKKLKRNYQGSTVGFEVIPNDCCENVFN